MLLPLPSPQWALCMRPFHPSHGTMYVEPHLVVRFPMVFYPDRSFLPAAQSDGKVSVYVMSGIDGVGDLPKDQVNCVFGERSFDLTITNLNGECVCCGHRVVWVLSCG